MTDALRVLVVDDNDMGRELAHDILANAGYDVVEASTVAEALSSLDATGASLILLDWHLKGSTGADVLKAVRTSDLRTRTRVLVATADIRVELRETALAAGADGLIAKPYRAEALVEAVASVLETTGGGET